ncbi:MAG: hypothetical protein PUD08_03080, partial [bacterium]|nr:hypothetical protein [bacterium]
MNKKFSTLLVSALLAGSFCFHADAKKGAQITDLSKITNGQVVYLASVADAQFIVINSDNGAQLLNGPVAAVDAATNANYAYWQWK